MGYLGVGILVASLSFALYKYKISATCTTEENPKRPSSDQKRPDRNITEKSYENGRGPFISVVEAEEEHGNQDAPPIGTQNRYLVHRPLAAPKNFSLPQLGAVKSPGMVDMPPPARPESNARRKDGSTSTSMPQPSQKLSTPLAFKMPPKPSTSLRPPPSAASSLRTPPTRSLGSLSLAPTTSTLAPSSRPSKKVILEPGHSPLDWAHLTANPPTPSFLRGKDVPPNLIRVPPSLLKYHNGRKGKDAWGVWQGKVYNLTPYMKFHPGGVDQLMRGAGREKEGERLFNETHPWVSWDNMLGECLVGILVSENEALKELGEEMDEMD